ADVKEADGGVPGLEDLRQLAVLEVDGRGLAAEKPEDGRADQEQHEEPGGAAQPGGPAVLTTFLHCRCLRARPCPAPVREPTVLPLSVACYLYCTAATEPGQRKPRAGAVPQLRAARKKPRSCAQFRNSTPTRPAEGCLGLGETSR